MRATRLFAMLLAVGALLPACFDPKLQPGFDCGEDSNGDPVCPPGFVCDVVPYVCVRNGTQLTPPSVELGVMQPGPAAGRLGDDFVVAGWVYNSTTQTSTFQIRTFDSGGKQVGQPNTPPEFSDVDPTTLRAVGSDNVVVIAGRKQSDQSVQSAWVTTAGVDGRNTGVAYDAFTTTHSPSLVCLVGGYTPPSGTTYFDVQCNDGGFTTNPQISTQNSEAIFSVAAGVADDHTKVVIVAEAPGANDSLRQLWVFCPGQDPSDASIKAQRRMSNENLAPQLFYSPAPGDNLLQVAWKSTTGFKTAAIDLTNCPATATDLLVSDSQVSGFNLVGRGQSTGWTGGAGVWTLNMHPGADPSVADLLAMTENPVSVDHDIRSHPHALTTKDGAPWFFLFATDSDKPTQGWFKYFALVGMTDVRYLDYPVTSDFVVGRRNAGTFYVVYRTDKDATGDDSQPLPAYLLLLDHAGDVEAPSK